MLSESVCSHEAAVGAREPLYLLLRECYCLAAGLIIGEAAAADVDGYRDARLTRHLERDFTTPGAYHALPPAKSPLKKGSLAEGGGEAEVREGSAVTLPRKEYLSPASDLARQLTRLCPLLSKEGVTGDAASAATPADRPLRPHGLCSSDQTAAETHGVSAPLISTAPAAESKWWYPVADALDALLDAADACFGTAPDAPFSFLVLPPAALGGRSLVQIEASLTKSSCIMAGLLLQREVRLRNGPCYTTVVPPLLVVLDLDGTVLRSPLSTTSLQMVSKAAAADVQELFVDANFLRCFCAAVDQQGHAIAICSLTEGTADQQKCGLSVEEAVLCLLSRVLPPTRTYLNSADDVVCLPRSIAGPGKLFHLAALQERRNARDSLQESCSIPPCPHPATSKTSVAISWEGTVGGAGNDVLASPRFDHGLHAHDASAPLLPKWLSTDVVLIDDDRENCRLALTQGYHATPCTDTGMTVGWYRKNPELQVLLGVTADELAA